MVGGTGHSAYSVVARWETSGDSSLQETFSVSGVVDTPEEDECGWVGRS